MKKYNPQKTLVSMLDLKCDILKHITRYKVQTDLHTRSKSTSGATAHSEIW
jgi:hypothetical protein